MPSTDILADYVEVPQLAAAFKKCERTIIRWMDEPNGLPYVKIGNKRLVHVPSAKEWIFAKLRRRNSPQSRRGR